MLSVRLFGPPQLILDGRPLNLTRRKSKGLLLDSASGIRVDADEFARLSRSARAVEADNPQQAIGLYESALALYHGDFLQESPYAEWAGEERECRLADYLSWSAW